MEKFTKKELKKLHKRADEIQPDVTREQNLKGASENDAALYDKLMGIYNELCKDDVTFSLTFVLPDSLKPMSFFRVTQPEDKPRFIKLGSLLMDCMYSFLCWSGLMKDKEAEGYIKILPKGEHKTWMEQAKEQKK